MFTILTLNHIAEAGLRRLPADRYQIQEQAEQPDGILVRSHDLHAMAIPASVQAVGRAGAGVNNIPVGAMSARGVPVFNAPGANANAVKELVVAGMLIASRHLCGAWDQVRGLDLDDDALNEAIEAGKKRFVGVELAGRTLGVIGLGAIGGQVANAAMGLGMSVIGHDPKLTVQHAWELSSRVEQAADLDDLLRRAAFVTVHVPLLPATRHLIDAARLERVRSGAVLLNFARAGIVDDTAALAALDRGNLAAYVTDFPTRATLAHPQVLAFPHLGASTVEAEENCAVMVADHLRAYLEDGVIRDAVNFPDADLPRNHAHRLTVATANVPNMVSQISSALGAVGLNIAGVLNKSRGDMAYTIVDLDGPVPAPTMEALMRIDHVLRVRDLGQRSA